MNTLNDKDLWAEYPLPEPAELLAHRHLNGLRAIAHKAAQAERHRIYAALEADPGSLWRDQGFQEWRRNRVQD